MKDSKYKYNFDENSIGEFIDFNVIKIPFCSLKDWENLYSIMPKGEKKAELIREYLKNRKR
ncbi:MAG: hypothetical protein AB1Z23_05210 [Eubacteriales bacterium]